jgi:hypothetical protein
VAHAVAADADKGTEPSMLPLGGVSWKG